MFFNPCCLLSVLHFQANFHRCKNNSTAGVVSKVVGATVLLVAPAPGLGVSQEGSNNEAAAPPPLPQLAQEGRQLVVAVAGLGRRRCATA
jgi:hypothetical protein